MKITNHSELRKRCSLKLNKTVKTDQSYKNLCDINLIVSNYNKTGVLSHVKSNLPTYMDHTEIPSLMEAHAIVRDAQAAFMELPSQIRKLMDHNPKNLESFIQNPENRDLLEKNGILEKIVKIETPKEELKVEPKTVEKPTQKE